jgi:hypothetical protein
MKLSKKIENIEQRLVGYFQPEIQDLVSLGGKKELLEMLVRMAGMKALSLYIWEELHEADDD